MTEAYKISIIVPVYNTEKYLSRCLDSLLLQTIDSYEVIVVDDGSTDCSVSIVEKYVVENPEVFKLYRQNNAGPGSARNLGLLHANGQYVGFVDSDDEVVPQMFEKMYDACLIGKLDCIICDILCIDDLSGNQWISPGYRGKYTPLTINDFMCNCMNPAFAWNKLFKNELFSIIRFSNTWYEDVATIPILLSYAKKIGYLQESLYFYRQREGSVTRSSGNFNTLDIVKAWERCLDGCKELFYDEIVYSIYKSICEFLNFKDEFSDEFLKYANKKRELFEANRYIKSDIENNIIQNIL